MTKSENDFEDADAFVCLPLNLSPHLGKSKTPIVTSITKNETEAFHFGQAGKFF